MGGVDGAAYLSHYFPSPKGRREMDEWKGGGRKSIEIALKKRRVHTQGPAKGNDKKFFCPHLP